MRGEAKCASEEVNTVERPKSGHFLAFSPRLANGKDANKEVRVEWRALPEENPRLGEGPVVPGEKHGDGGNHVPNEQGGEHDVRFGRLNRSVCRVKLVPRASPGVENVIKGHDVGGTEELVEECHGTVAETSQHVCVCDSFLTTSSNQERT